MSQGVATGAMLVLAAVLQILAAIAAVRLEPIGGMRRWWFLISAALVIQAGRRVFMLGEPSPLVDVVAACTISGLFLAGVLGIRKTFSRERRTRRTLAEERGREESYSHYADVAIVVLDEDARIRSMNPTARAILSCEERDALGKEWFETFVADEARLELRDRFTRLMTSPIEDDAYVQYDLVDSKGHEHPMVWHRRVLRDNDGRSVGARSAGIDLTEQKRLEGELALHSLLLRATTDSVVAYRPDGTIVYCNEAASRYRGHNRSSIAGANMRELVPPAAQGAFDECREAVMRGETAAYETRDTDANGVVRTLDAEARLVTVGDEELIVDAARDVTERKRAEDALRENDAHKDSLLRLYALLGRANSHAAIVEALCTGIPRTLGYPSIGLFVLDEKSDSVRMLQACGPMARAAKIAMALDDRFRKESQGAESLIVPIGNDPFLREIVEADRIVVIDDARTDPRISREIVAAMGTRTIISVPLVLAGTKLGILYTGTFGDAEGVRPPSQVQLDYLSALANHVAVAMDRVRFLGERQSAEEALERTIDEAEATLDGVVRALASTTGVRDLYSAMHQERVAQLACAIAGEMGLPATTVDGIRIAGVLHDIGKIGIPAAILAKPGALNEMEFGIVRAHSEAGQRMLENVPFHSPVATIVRQHHERLDGSGYPDGITGDEMLLESKILAVADVVEAMTSHRPYRAAMTVGAAIDEIERGAGRTFDREVVDACVSVLTAESRLPVPS